MSRVLIAGLDFETTGLDQEKGHRIIEAAAAIYELDTRKRVGQFETRINPQRGIDPEATEIHGITFEELVGKPVWEEVAPKLSKVLQMTPYVIAHNGMGFDFPFVCREFVRVGVEVPQFRPIDTMLSARWATPDGALPSLKALCFACGIEYDESKAHAALYDVEVMMDCFFSQYDRGLFPLPVEFYQLPPSSSAKKGR